jgi:hypothetical protein
MTPSAHLKRKFDRWRDAAVYSLLSVAALLGLAGMVWVFLTVTKLPH